MKKKKLSKKIECMVLVLFIFCISHLVAAPCGDVNSDGSIDIVDPLLIAQYFVGLDPENFDQNAADVDADGSINIVDALLIAQYYVGLITELPGCTETPTPTPDPNAPVGPEGYTYCADEGVSVTFDMYVNVAYGADGNFNYLYEVTGTITFDNDTFGDPIHGTVKHGFYQVGGTPTPTPEITPTPTQGPTADPSVPSGPFANEPDGFASLNGGTTGGEGGQTVTVTNQSDLEQYAGASEPYIIKVQGTITISPSGFEVSIASNKTIVGVGSDATIEKGGFRIIENQNVILRNLTVRDGSGSDSDGLQTDTARNIWVNHIHFTNFSDGVMDIRKDTSYFTASWCFFTDNNRGPTFGWTDITDSKVTMHHCLIRNTVKRNPVFDQGFGHFYNNYSVNVSSFGHQARGNAKMVVENSYWDNVNNPYGARDSNSILEVRGSIVINSSGTQETQGGFAFDPSSYYSYTLDPTEDVPDLILNYAGPSDQIQY